MRVVHHDQAGAILDLLSIEPKLVSGAEGESVVVNVGVVAAPIRRNGVSGAGGGGYG